MSEFGWLALALMGLIGFCLFMAHRTSRPRLYRWITCQVCEGDPGGTLGLEPCVVCDGEGGWWWRDR